jgi:hypothetical protein
MWKRAQWYIIEGSYTIPPQADHEKQITVTSEIWSFKTTYQ